jgi:DNA (cytosine-5)-methyltransferase 1
MAKPNAIDLFSGAGGLTVGLRRAGFRVVAAVEMDNEAARTYKANHRSTELITRDITEVTGRELLRVSGADRIDLVAGCPPCQGFSSLTNKYAKSDPRNRLLLEMARLIAEIRPNMIMMENVPGLAEKGKSVFRRFISKLESLGYRVTYDVLQVADYGIPQSRRRLVLLAGRGFEIPLPISTHSAPSAKGAGLKSWRTLGDVLRRRRRPVTLSYARQKGGPAKFNWHVIRDLTPLSLTRLEALNAGADRRNLPKNLRPACHRRSDKGFQNVYGRLSWSQTPPTITGGCTTPCKGRFGHPDETRTISVREAADIQTFPADYIFDTDFMEVACNLVGNALPCDFAYQVSRACISRYKRHLRGIR